MREAFEAHANYKNGFLPRAGSIDDQDARLIEAIGLIEAEDAAIDLLELEQLRRKGMK